MQPVTNIMRRHGTDKVTAHSYGPVYERLFTPAFRERATAVLEIGVYVGNGLRAWAEIFPNAEVLGTDSYSTTIEPCRPFRVLIGDQGCPGDWLEIIPQLPPLDVVIDDGNHQPHGQCVSVAALWPILKPGGIYIVEDVADPHTINLFRSMPGLEVFDLSATSGRADDRLVVARKPGAT